MSRMVSRNEVQANYQGYTGQGLGQQPVYGQQPLYGQQPGMMQQQPGMMQQQQPGQRPGEVVVAVPSNQMNNGQGPQKPNGGGGYGGAGALTGNAQAVAAMDIAVRQGFVRKVFTILAIQLTITFGSVILFATVDAAKDFAVQNSFLFPFAFGVYIVTVLALSCCPTVARTHPYGIIFLGLLTLALSFLLGVIASQQDELAVFTAVGGTVAVTAGLTLFACQTKYDFTGLGPYLLVALIGFFIFSIVLAFVDESDLTRTIFASIGLVLFGFFLVYDVQLVIGGEHKKYQLEVDEYIFAALNIYLDVVQIFLLILSLTESN